MAQLKRFRKIQTNSDELNRVQDNVAEVLNELLLNPLARSIPRQGVLFVTGSNRFSHGLGRRYFSCLIGPPSVGGVSFSIVPDKDPTNYITISASAPCTADLLVY